MDAKVSWRLMTDVCHIGEFIAATGVDGASANMVGEFRVSHNGAANVLERQACHDHMHLDPAQIKALHSHTVMLVTAWSLVWSGSMRTIRLP
jgi:hypothetical protein